MKYSGNTVIFWKLCFLHCWIYKAPYKALTASAMPFLFKLFQVHNVTLWSLWFITKLHRLYKQFHFCLVLMQLVQELPYSGKNIHSMYMCVFCHVSDFNSMNDGEDEKKRVKGPFELQKCLSPCHHIYLLSSSPKESAGIWEAARGCAAEKEGGPGEMNMIQTDSCVIKQSSARLVLEVFLTLLLSVITQWLKSGHRES